MITRFLLRLLTIACCCAVLAPLSALSQPTVYVVRHGEKIDDSKDPALSPAGEARAERLAFMLSAAGIKAIYVTEYRRTQQTAAPLAKRLGMVPGVIAAADGAALIRQVSAHPAGIAVLVVAHSNSVPAVVKALGVAEPVKLAEEDFDNLFVVQPGPGAPTLLRLKY